MAALLFDWGTTRPATAPANSTSAPYAGSPSTTRKPRALA
jgi:hypothetical protein